MLFTEEALYEQRNGNLSEGILNEDKDVIGIWTLEFDGSCASSGFGTGVVLIPPGGEPEPMAFRLEFGNVNNTIEYEALLLGIMIEKERGINILKA